MLFIYMRHSYNLLVVEMAHGSTSATVSQNINRSICEWASLRAVDSTCVSMCRLIKFQKKIYYEKHLTKLCCIICIILYIMFRFDASNTYAITQFGAEINFGIIIKQEKVFIWNIDCMWFFYLHVFAKINAFV